MHVTFVILFVQLPLCSIGHVKARRVRLIFMLVLLAIAVGLAWIIELTRSQKLAVVRSTAVSVAVFIVLYVRIT